MPGISIGFLPYSQKYSPAILLVGLRSAPGVNLRLTKLHERLTASPATVYRSDPIEAPASLAYSVIHARECLPASELSGT